MKLSDNLKRIRKENGLSQEQLAEKLGVSRQAVSKWESGQSYPEMDKVLLICKLFNYKIDELMNENVKEVDENKQSKSNINKYVDDFFDFITKTVDMLTSMTFKQKVKCVLEQFIVGMILFMIFGTFGSIAFNILENLLGGFLRLTSILSAIYGVFALIIGIIILLHIFKIRYLDYYEIIKEEKIEERVNENKVMNIEENNINKDEKITLEKKKQKVIIRDPAHSEAKFLNGIIKIVITFIKFIAVWFGLFFAITFLGLVSILVLSFLFVKTGAFFIGCFMGIISLLVMNFIALQILYNFIVNKRNSKLKIAIGILSSLIVGGISIGILLIGMTSFNYIENASNFNKQDEYVYEMKENLSISRAIGNLELEYIENDLADIKIVIKHSEYTKVTNIMQDDNTIDLWCEPDNTRVMELFRKVIQDINNKKLQDYSKMKVYVYASKENIEKLKENKNKKYEESLKSEIDNLENKNIELEQKIENLEDKLEEKDSLIYDLKEELREIRENS